MKQEKIKLIKIITGLYHITEEKAYKDVAFKKYIHLSNDKSKRITGISMSDDLKIIYHLEDTNLVSYGWSDIAELEIKMLKKIKKELQTLNGL